MGEWAEPRAAVSVAPWQSRGSESETRLKGFAAALATASPYLRIVLILIACASVTVVGRMAFAADPIELSVAAAVARAFEAGGAARIENLREAQAEADIGRTRSAFLPQLAVTSGAGYSNRQNEKLRAVDENGRERVYGLASLGSGEGWFNVFVDQLLFDLRQVNELEAAKVRAEAAQVATDERREEVAQQVLGICSRLIGLELRARLARELAMQAADLSARAESMAKAGTALASEREEAAIAAEGARLFVDETKAEIAAGRAELAAAIGLGIAESASLEIDADSLPVPTLEAGAADDTFLAATAELRAFELRRRLAEFRRDGARAGRLPTVGVRGGYSNYGSNRYDNFPDEWRIGLDVTVPLFDGMRSRYEIAAAANAEEMARIEYKLALERKRRRVSDLTRRVQLSLRAADLAERGSANAAKGLELANLRLRAGRGSVSEVAAAGQRYRTSRERAIDARFEPLRLWAMLERELGRLAHSLNPPVDERPPG